MQAKSWSLRNRGNFSTFLNLPCIWLVDSEGQESSMLQSMGSQRVRHNLVTDQPPAPIIQPSGSSEQPLGVERASPGSGEWEPHPLVEKKNTRWSAQ